MSSTPSKTADITKLVLALLAAGVVVLLVVAFLLRGGFSGSSGIDGRVHYFTKDRSYSLSIGPNGWFAYGDEDGDWVEHAPTGERWEQGSAFGSAVLTSEGAVVTTLGGDVRVERESGLAEARATDLLVAHGDKAVSYTHLTLPTNREV